MQYNNFIKVLLLLSFFGTLSLAKIPQSVEFFEDKPKGNAKDFFIYRYLQKPTTSPNEAWKLLEHTKRMSNKLFHAFAMRIDEPGFKKASTCMKMELSELLKQDDECLAIGFSLYDATKLPKPRLKEIEKRLLEYPIAKALPVLYSKSPFEALVSSSPNLFFQVYNSVGKAYRQKFFDKPLPKEFIASLEGDWELNRTIKYTILDPKMDSFNKSLIHIDRFDKTLTHQSLFFLGLNALQLRYEKLALAFLEEAYKKAYYRMDKDKVTFWKFLITKDKTYKEQLKKSKDLNIYTLLAGAKNERIMIAKAWEEHPSYDITDPFGWTNLLNDMKDKNSTQLEAMAKGFLYGPTLPHFSFLMERASKYTDHYFPLPYKQHLKEVDKQRIALIMAIARQESRFVPSAVSHSYALGMMQFMPFLARAIAKEKNLQDFDLTDMFKPKVALDFANHHLDYLERHLYHPLFIAYAYNGGIGFTKRLLQSGTFLDGPYEPFMSMELVHYDESRKYGKKVLANYIIYMRILHQNVSVYKLFEDLTKPSKTDGFR